MYLYMIIYILNEKGNIGVTHFQFEFQGFVDNRNNFDWYSLENKF